MWTLALLASTALLVYLVGCRWWPVTACRRCDGSGKVRSPNGRNWRPCKRCSGSGGRLRIGRRVMNGLSRNARNL